MPLVAGKLVVEREIVEVGCSAIWESLPQRGERLQNMIAEKRRVFPDFGDLGQIIHAPGELRRDAVSLHENPFHQSNLPRESGGGIRIARVRIQRCKTIEFRNVRFVDLNQILETQACGAHVDIRVAVSRLGTRDVEARIYDCVNAPRSMKSRFLPRNLAAQTEES